MKNIELIVIGVVILFLSLLFWSWHHRGNVIEKQNIVIENYKTTEKLGIDNQLVDVRVKDEVKKRKDALNEIKVSDCGVSDALRHAHDSVYSR
jgi:hypothetical protein